MSVKALLAAAAAVLLSLGAPASAQVADATLVFAAASLKNALDAAVEDYTATTGKQVTVSYAASSALAKQIEEGAPADIFFSADLDWMGYLQEKRLIVPDTRVTLLGNDIVLVAPADANTALDIAPGFDLAGALGDGKLAMAATASVPAGKYGKAALEALGAWEGVAANVAETDNVRAALEFVARGEAALGIVYTSDAKAEPRVKVVDTFPADSHRPILYPVALTAAANSDARAFLDYLVSSKAQPHFEAQGFKFTAPGS
jgi:molybdate transport system substrate-binding protein